MGKVFDSTDKFSIFETKARTYKNMSKDNYYLKSLQEKVNDEWKYRYNIVDIEEEKEFGGESYNSIEVKIQNVYDEKLKKVLSDDWKKINFKDIQYPITLGQRYRFSLDFNEKNESLKNSSIWITLNVNKTNPTSGGILRRCDSFITVVSDKGDIHYEPICLDTDFKYSSIYYDLSISIAQGEIYATMQYNKYTKFLKVNDRFIIGPVDAIDRYNNTVYKIKAIRRYQSLNTFDLNSIPLIFLALERDDISPNDNFENRVAFSNGRYREEDYFQEDIDLIYDSERTIISIDFEPPEEDDENDDNNVPDVEQNDEIIQDDINEDTDDMIVRDADDSILSYKGEELKIEVITENGTPIDERILLNETKIFYCYVYKDDIQIKCPVSVETDLLATDKDEYYYEYKKEDENSFSILNKKMYLKDELKIRCYYEDVENDIFVEKEFLVSLGGLT